MRGAILLVLLAAFGGGCSFGMSAQRFKPAQQPGGIETSITTANAFLNGELIEVRDAGLVLLCDRVAIRHSRTTNRQQLRLVPYEVMIAAWFDQLNFGIANGQGPIPERRERLRLLSRYPYGLSSALLLNLLKANGQTALAGIEP